MILHHTLRPGPCIGLFCAANSSVQSYTPAVSILDFKGELQRQNKLISFERPFKILQNDTKIIKMATPFSKYLTLKIKIWTILREKTTEKPKMLFFRGFAQAKEQ